VDNLVKTSLSAEDSAVHQLLEQLLTGEEVVVISKCNDEWMKETTLDHSACACQQ
jgi:hypothetical protein